MENDYIISNYEIKDKTPFLVDVPVRINIWIRPECQKLQFEVLRKAKPSILFIQSDGGRNEEEWEAIRKNRKLFDENIDWNCKVFKIYFNKNFGLYEKSRIGSKIIWDNVDRCIFLEDDQIPSISFFRFHAEMLEKYKNDERIECVCGMNHLGVYDHCDYDYFFSRQGSIWGCSTWKRCVMNRNSFSYHESPYTMKLLSKNVKKASPFFYKRLCEYKDKNSLYEGHVPGGEFWIEYNVFCQNKLQIIPKYNLISNLGNGTNSLHFMKKNKKLDKLFNMRAYELNFPLNENNFVIADLEYEKKRNKTFYYDNLFLNFLNRVFSHFSK